MRWPALLVALSAQFFFAFSLSTAHVASQEKAKDERGREGVSKLRRRLNLFKGALESRPSHDAWALKHHLRDIPTADGISDSIPDWGDDYPNPLGTSKEEEAGPLLGNSCTWETKDEQCGDKWICKDKKCAECDVSRDCGEHFLCEASNDGRKTCVARDLFLQWDWMEVLLTILIILAAMLSAAAGMGGGGVFVPLLLLLGGLSTKEAVPLSQAMIVGGATVNVLMFCGEKHPLYPERPKIDYEVLMMLNPGLAAGVTIGVLCHVISPQWLIVLTLNITLIIALQKSASKGIQSWKKETKMLEEQKAAENGTPGRGDRPTTALKIKLADFRGFATLAVSNRRQVGLILGSWMTFMILNMYKAPQCSELYWCQMLGMLVVCGAYTFAGAATLNGSTPAGEEDGRLVWTARTLWLYPLLSTGAGFLGGFLGIGGGIIMGPMLIELGMVPEANQATTATFVFLSSTLATIQFVVLGKTMPQYVVWFTTWVVIATFVGQTGLDYILRKYQRSSLIVLSIAGIIGCSLVMMTVIGASDIYSDLMRGADMGFDVRQLCGRGHR